MANRTKEWLAYRKEWLKDNPPSFEGYHYCHYGGKALDYAILDHKDGRVGDLMTDPDNIVKSCQSHNSIKGSMKYDKFMEYLEANPKLKKCKF